MFNALQDSEVSELSELSEDEVKYRRTESKYRAASPAPSMEDPDNAVRTNLKQTADAQFIHILSYNLYV